MCLLTALGSASALPLGRDGGGPDALPGAHLGVLGNGGKPIALGPGGAELDELDVGLARWAFKQNSSSPTDSTNGTVAARAPPTDLRGNNGGPRISTKRQLFTKVLRMISRKKL